MNMKIGKFYLPNKSSIIIVCIVFSISSIYFISDGRIEETEVFKPTWDAMISDRKVALEILPNYVPFPENATTWADYAEKCYEDLLTFDESWFIEPSTGIKGFRPYVKGADGWGGEDWTREITELMAEMDVLWPMYRYLELHPNSTRQTMIEEFIQELPKYYSVTYEQSTNRPGENKHDSWYYMENSVLKYGHLYLISNISVLEDPYFGSLGSGIEMAHNFDYQFPQFVNLQKNAASGYNTVNYCTAGLLAYSLITAYELTNNTSYLFEAENALNSLRNVNPPHMTLYEPQELAAAVAAAAKLTQYMDIVPYTDFAQLALDFFYAQEQMLYYDNGQTMLLNFGPISSTWLPQTWRDGLHSPYYNPTEYGGINAPAFKESVESVMFWNDFLRYMYFSPDINMKVPLRVLNLNRINNFYHFSPNIPDEQERDYGPNTLQYIPYEDIDYYALRDWENESVRYKTGYNGKEIYGAGETLWSYMMFEALGESQDRNSLLLNLNVFDQNLTKPENRAYIAWNPYNETKTLNFTLKHLDDPYNVYINGTPIMDDGSIQEFLPGNILQLTFPSEGTAYITLNNNIPPPPSEPLPRPTTTTTTTITTSSITTTTSTTTTEPNNTSTSTTSTSTASTPFVEITFILMALVFIKTLRVKEE